MFKSIDGSGEIVMLTFSLLRIEARRLAEEMARKQAELEARLTCKLVYQFSENRRNLKPDFG